APRPGTREPVARAGGWRHHHLAAGAMEHLRRVHGGHAGRADADLPAVLLLQPDQPAARHDLCARGFPGYTHQRRRGSPRRVTRSLLKNDAPPTGGAFFSASSSFRAAGTRLPPSPPRASQPAPTSAMASAATARRKPEI